MIVSVVVCLTAELARAIHRSFLRGLRSLDRRMTAVAVRRELDAMPDFLLRDLGLTRGDIGYVARVSHRNLLRAPARSSPRSVSPDRPIAH